MIFNNYHELKDIKFDLIIVGSGPAGISLALELEGQKFLHLLLKQVKIILARKVKNFMKVKLLVTIIHLYR